MKRFTKLAAIGGAGTIGSAIVSAVVSKGLFAPRRVMVSARHKDSLAAVAHLGVMTTMDNREAVAFGDVVLLSVHPDQALPLVQACRGKFRAGQLLLSVVTGVTVEDLRKASGGKAAVIRAMPNIATLVGASVTTLAPGAGVAADAIAFAQTFFDAVGSTLVLDESHLDACTGLGGCGPAFALKVIESLAAGGVKMGLPREVSRRMSAGVLLGAAKLVLETRRHPAELKDEVTTPGGCTIDGIAKLEEKGLPIALIDAVEASTIKAARLRVRGKG